MVLKLYNTLTRKKDVFKPLVKGKVGMYSCGPTVYWYQHIGNMRSYLFTDVLKRVLIYNGYKISHISNVTDVGHLTSDADEGEDKIERAAAKEGKKASQIAKFYFNVFEKDLEKLNVLMPNKWVWATGHIKEQIDLIKKLEKKGYTYKTSDGIYFDSARFKNYGRLAKLNIGGLKEGKRIAKREKKNKTDFALWKFSDPNADVKRQQEWKSPWGVGFPGWHLECSAMSMKYLGARFDLHTGGEDHVPIHHTNEIAQSEAATGRKFVNYWLHGAFLLRKGEKVSKSKGGWYTISDLENEGYEAVHFRYLSLLTHYRKQLNFNLDNLDAAKNAYERLKRKIIELGKQEHKGKDNTREYEKKFLEAVNDDLNISRALDVFWKALNDFNFSPKKKVKLLEKFDNVLGLGVKDMRETYLRVSKEVRDLIVKREKARQSGDWAEADVLRNMIKERGFTVEDTLAGPKAQKA
jgi:cysteinyl-tRNA synthetase